MTLKGPYVTIAAGVVVAAIVLGLSITAAGRDKDRTARNAAARNAATESATRPSAESPAPSRPATQDPTPKTYAGEIQGLGGSIAVAVNGRSAVGYVCDGRRVEAWYQGGTGDGTTFTLAGTAEGATLSATLAQGALAGTVRIAGRDLAFTARPVESPNGLFRSVEQAAADQAATVTGWIVTPQGQVGVRRRGTEVGPAPVLDPTNATATVDGRTVRAVPVTGTPL